MVLLVHPNGSKYWWLRYRFGGKEKMLALGKYPEVSLADAWARRDEARKLLANGVDPSGNKNKAEHLGERRLMLQWWADYLDANRGKGVSLFDFGNNSNVLKWCNYLSFLYFKSARSIWSAELVEEFGTFCV